MTQDVNWVYGVEVLCAKKSVQKFTEKDLVQARVTASANTDWCQAFHRANQLTSFYILENWSWIGKRYVKSAKNTVISTNFLVWKFYGNAEFPHSFGWFARNYAKLCLFTKFPHQEIRWKLRYFLQYKGNSMFKISNEITTKLYGLFSVNLQIGILVREIVGISKCRKI